jgi:hypothetical protein
MKLAAFVVLLLFTIAASEVTRRVHYHAEVIDDKSGGGSYSILAPFYWLFDRIPFAGPYLNSALHSFAGMFPAAIFAVPAIGIATGITALWTLLGYYVLRRLWSEWSFSKALKATHSGPVAVVKEYCVCGKSAGEKLNQYVNNMIIPFALKQPGMTRYHVSRGLRNPNTFVVCMEWSTLEDLRRAICSPEGASIKKNAPWQVWLTGVKKCLVVPTTSGIGPAGRTDAPGTVVTERRKVVTS